MEHKRIKCKWIKPLSPSDLSFVAQHIDKIIKELKPKYKFVAQYIDNIIIELKQK